MTPCVGWMGPCSVHGLTHGCKHADGHSAPKWHECECGDRARAYIARVGRGEPIYRVTDRRGRRVA